MKYQHDWALIAHDLDVGLMYLCSLCFLYLSNNLENYLSTLILIQYRTTDNQFVDHQRSFHRPTPCQSPNSRSPHHELTAMA
ncbi:hypothetical protein L1987_51641 [Smallanthus sonchifolius]|uniref:Uncharacterized protein n=1 Tax=Smallanthus sonchifolius TaxID=185202 RepID=A0ACB9EQB6_9ASTR|nr:hypothetical protein L1987_51641 [Smallanthus sonchifolius]